MIDDRELRVGDQVELRKPHPCGSRRWEVIRVGADVGLRCLGCGHRILLSRGRFRKRLKRIHPFSPPLGGGGEGTP